MVRATGRSRSIAVMRTKMSDDDAAKPILKITDFEQIYGIHCRFDVQQITYLIGSDSIASWTMALSSSALSRMRNSSDRGPWSFPSMAKRVASTEAHARTHLASVLLDHG